MHNCLSTYLQRDKCLVKQPVSLVDVQYGLIVSTGSLRASPLHGDRVPAHPVCSSALLSCYMGTHSAAVRRRDARSVLVTLAQAVSDADDRRGDLYTSLCPSGGRTPTRCPPTSGQFAAI